MRMAGFCMMLALALPACKTQQASVEQRSVGKVTETPVDLDKDNAPAATLEIAQRIAVALTRHPEPFLSVRAPNRAPSLRAQAGQPVSFDLDVPGLARWADATVARFVVRLPGGVQDTVTIDLSSGRPLVTYTFPSEGPDILIPFEGPQGNAPDPSTLVTHCSKVIVSVADVRGVGEGGDDFTGETGLPLDVVPLVSPAHLGVGSELPVSFHYMTEEEGGIEV